MSGGKLSDDRIHHLQMLQGVIARMAGASSAIKNLCLIVVAGALAFIAASKNPTVALFATALTVVFWFLDARYLQREKWFRNMFDAERVRDPAEPASFQMTPDAATRSATRLGYGIRSSSTWGLYLPLFAFLLALCVLIPGADPLTKGCSHD